MRKRAGADQAGHPVHASMDRLDRIERTQQRLWLLALFLFLLLATSLFLLDAITVIEEQAGLRWPGMFLGKLRGYGPASALLVIATLISIYFYERLLAVRTANRDLVRQLETSARVLAQRNQQLDAWSQLSHTLITNFNLPRLLDLTVHTAAEVTESDCAVVVLAEKGARHLRLAAIHERGLQIELAERVAWVVIQTGQPLSLSPDAPPPEFDRPDLPWEDLVSLVAEPLVTAEQVVGALLVGRVRPHEPFSAQVLETLASFANQASVALEKAHLYAENQRQLDRLEKLLEDLHAAQSQLSQAGRAAGLGVLSGGVAYVINQPLAGIMARTERLLERNDWEVETVRAEVSVIHQQARRAVQTLTGLLGLSRRPSSAVPGSVDVNATVHQILGIMRPECRAANIEVEESYDVVPAVRANTFQLEQALVSLFVNALHEMPAGGRLSVRTMAGKGDWVDIEVQDFRGIPSRIADNDLESFGVPHVDRLETGLGLAAASRLVRSQGGTIKIDKDTGLGTRVLMRLPTPGDADLTQVMLETETPEAEAEPLVGVSLEDQGR